ncbi:MAG TPA: hypothetical protein VFH58_01705 [Acidimicrobiales bacterium]|nr:hypothetical protein [Acidimicrobiales bacterium]
MDYVIIGTHSAEVCPTSNSRTRQLLQEMAPKIPKIAEQAGVKIIAGPYVNREHVTVSVIQAANGEDLDRFIVESRLAQWNSIRVLPSLSMAQGISELEDQPALF